MLTTNYIKEVQALIINYKNLVIAKENLIDKLIEQNVKMEGYKGQDFSGMPTGHGGNEDKMLNMIFQKEAIIEQLLLTNKRIEKLEKAFRVLDEKEIEFIKIGFDDNFTDTAIAGKLKISKRQLYRKRKDVVKKIAKKIWGYI